MATFEIDATNENLILHIKGLQDTLSARNREIQELKARTPIRILREEEKREAFAEGWRACCSKITSEVQRSRDALANLSKVAFSEYITYSQVNYEDYED